MKNVSNQLAGLKPIEVSEVCAIHNCKKVNLRGSRRPAVCLICAKDELDREKEQLVVNFEEKQASSTLYRASLVDDADVVQCSFANYQYKDKSLEAVNRNKCRYIAGEYMKNPAAQFNTLLIGMPGSGKTHLAYSMLKAVNENAKPKQACLFVNISRLLTKVKSAFNNTSSWFTQDNIINLLTKVDLLVLDDLGTESAMRSDTEASQWVQDMLYQIINKQKRIIITTNLSIEQLKKAYNYKLVSRILRGTAGHMVDFTGIKDKRILGNKF